MKCSFCQLDYNIPKEIPSNDFFNQLLIEIQEKEKIL